MRTTATELLTHLRTLGVSLSVDGDRVRCIAPPGVLTAELRDQLGALKAELLTLLRHEAPTLTRADRERYRQAAGEFVFPTSSAQSRLWFLHRFEPDSALYNVPIALRFTGALDVSALSRAFDILLERHEPLRTTFRLDDGDPVQIVAPSVHPDSRLEVTDLSALPPDEADRRALELVVGASTGSFDLERGPVIRIRLIRVTPTEHRLLLVVHHIAVDALSCSLLLSELAALYAGLVAGQPAELPILDVQYGDYAIWQRGWLQGPALEQRLSYWRDQLRGPLAPLELRTDRLRPAFQRFHGDALVVPVPDQVGADFITFCRRNQVTLFTGALAAYAALLQRQSGQSDIAIGSPVSNRVGQELEPFIGVFLNTLVLRVSVDPKESFRALLARTKAITLDAFANQDVPFEKLVEELHPERDPSRSPFFQTMLTVQHTAGTDIQFPGLEVAPLTGMTWETAKFDLTIFLTENAGRLAVSFEYSTDLFDRETISVLGRRFVALLAEVLRHPDTDLGDLDRFLPGERDQVLKQWNATASPYDTTPLHLAVARRGAETPDRPAVQASAGSLSYGALGTLAARVATALRAAGVRPGDRVAVAAERSPRLVAGLLGVLQCGAAYVPLDPEYPRDRVAYVLADAGVSVLLTETALAESLARPEIVSVLLDVALPEADGVPAAEVEPTDLAYVIYTSGSTGKPKGVEIPHGAVANLLDSMRRVPGFTASDVLLAVTTIAFDIAGLELWLPLTSGATLYLASAAAARDPQQMQEALTTSKATMLQVTPSTWRLLVEAGWPGDPRLTAWTGGEALTTDLAAALLPKVGTLWNNYGPTETTIYSAAHRVQGPADLALGGPIHNTRFYVLDPDGHPQPVGTQGELWIGGAGVARGYHNRPELTAERFRTDPFADEAGARMYRTGDAVRWRPDGTLDYIGRLDRQVKLRGNRIELGEVETALSEQEGIRAAVAMVREDHPGDTRLVAYVVGPPAGSPVPDAIREALRARLPGYMVPSTIVALLSFPQTPNGKVDHKALPAPDASITEVSHYVAPATATETQLAGLWQGVLGVSRVGRTDDFFELGGHSLLVLRLQMDIEATLGVRLPMRTIFQNSKLSGLAFEVDAAREAAPPSASSAPSGPGRVARDKYRRPVAPNPGAPGKGSGTPSKNP